MKVHVSIHRNTKRKSPCYIEYIVSDPRKVSYTIPDYYSDIEGEHTARAAARSFYQPLETQIEDIQREFHYLIREYAGNSNIPSELFLKLSKIVKSLELDIEII